MVCHIIELICWSDAMYLSCAPVVKTYVPFYFIIWFLSALSVLIVDFEIHFCVDCCFYYCTLLLIENHKLPLVFLSGWNRCEGHCSIICWYGRFICWADCNWYMLLLIIGTYCLSLLVSIPSPFPSCMPFLWIIIVLLVFLDNNHKLMLWSLCSRFRRSNDDRECIVVSLVSGIKHSL